MQFRVLVLVPSDTADVVAAVTDLMAPYNINRKVPPHKELVPEDEIQEIVTVFGLAADDLNAVVAELREESGFECWVEDGKVYWLTTDNPQGEWDSWRLGSLQDDVWPAPDVPQQCAPVAIITPNGEWNDLGIRDVAKKANEVVIFRERAAAHLQRYPTHLAVALDCHR